MTKPWYKQFWPWFVFAIPAISIFSSLTAVYIFSQNSVDLVAEDYYKKGKAINLDLTRLHQAQALNVKAELSLNHNDVQIQLDKGQLTQYPTLRVTFSHRTLADKDFQQMLSPNLSGKYVMQIPQSIDGPWFIEIEPFNDDWMLQGRVNMPISDPIWLYGKVKE
ncbi:TPA: FixH family protein [Photobacterium damselae]